MTERQDDLHADENTPADPAGAPVTPPTPLDGTWGERFRAKHGIHHADAEPADELTSVVPPSALPTWARRDPGASGVLPPPTGETPADTSGEATTPQAPWPSNYQQPPLYGLRPGPAQPARGDQPTQNLGQLFPPPGPQAWDGQQDSGLRPAAPQQHYPQQQWPPQGPPPQQYPQEQYPQEQYPPQQYPQQQYPPQANQPPVPEQQPATASQQSGGAQGSASKYNYNDTIRREEMVPERRVPPKRGWRHGVYMLTRINLGQSSDERYEAELEAKTRSLLRGKYRIGVVGKGGVGKSSNATMVGSLFAEYRQDDRVIAIDADTAFGKLGPRIDPKASNSYWEVAADKRLDSFSDIRSRVGSNASGLFVLVGEKATARRRVLGKDIYTEAVEQLDRHFSLSIIDCGSTMDSDVTKTVLNTLNALIVVTSPWFDGASAAGDTLEWLANNGYTGLLQRTVIIINDSDGHVSKKDVEHLKEQFASHGQNVFVMPYDEHVRPGGVIDMREGVSKRTRRKVLEVCAALAEHFAATTDAPRQVRR
ncbi:hypothetical protein [Mycolicibacterium llatzerense]|uniref:MinD/ParA family ATP-binding protein n=1 Tax=Mycolicibacterium llatzerense TaxID=280871 RepID=UPI0031CEA991